MNDSRVQLFWVVVLAHREQNRKLDKGPGWILKEIPPFLCCLQINLAHTYSDLQQLVLELSRHRLHSDCHLLKETRKEILPAFKAAAGVWFQCTDLSIYSILHSVDGRDNWALTSQIHTRLSLWVLKASSPLSARHSIRSLGVPSLSSRLTDLHSLSGLPKNINITTNTNTENYLNVVTNDV